MTDQDALGWVVDIGRQVGKNGLVGHHGFSLEFIDLLVFLYLGVQLVYQDCMNFQLRVREPAIFLGYQAKRVASGDYVSDGRIAFPIVWNFHLG
jgi:hypothetical protein